MTVAVGGILDSVDVPIVVVDRDGTITRFNRAAASVLALGQDDFGRLASSIPALDHVPGLGRLCARVIADGEPLRCDVERDDQSFVVRASPYEVDDRIEGVVLTFSNVTALRASITKAIHEREYTKTILNTVIDPLVVLDAELRVQTANRAFYEVFAIPRERAQNAFLADCGDEAWKGSALWPALRDVLAHADEDFRAIEVQRGASTLLVDARILARDADQPKTLLVAFRDITARKRADDVVRLQKEQFETLLNRAPMGVYLVDQEFRIRQVNPTAAPVFGSIPNVIGQDFGDVMRVLWPRAVADDVVSHFRETLATGKSYAVREFNADRADTGAHEFYDWQIHRIPLGEGALGVVCYFRDVSAHVLVRRSLEENEKRLERAKADAEGASRSKDEFLALVSHELRTPLTAMLGWIRMINGGDLPRDVAARGLGVIERNIRVQTHLIEDLLDVSRIVTGKLHVKFNAADLKQAIEAAVESVRPQLDAKKLALAMRLESLRVKGDQDRLQQIAWNLLSNAIKFTPAGGSIDVALERHDTHANLVIRDSGSGIAPDFLPYVFSRFEQADVRRTRNHGGLGLGLAIVKHLVEAHGGSVVVESDGEGKGATFKVDIPIGVFADDEALPESNAQPARELAGLRVLIVDDEADTRGLIDVVLQMSGAQTAVATSAREGLELLQFMRPHVLVSDISMPIEDGYSLIAKVRALPGDVARTPALALTALAREEDRDEALRAGFTSHVAKPVEPADFVRRVAALVR
ncbi:MAG TPA: ATP-binding protein [Polyangiaceae bacterium]